MPELRVTEILEATTGGTRRHVVDLLTHLDRGAFRPSLICAARRDAAFSADIATLRHAGIRVEVIDMRREVSPVADARALLRIRDLLRREPPDLVHTHSSKAGFLGRIAARRVGVPAIVHTSHVFPFLMAVSPFFRRLYTALERFAARRTDHLVCVCEDEARAAAAARLLPPERVHVIPNGIEAGEVRSAAAQGPGREETRRRVGIEAGAPLIAVIGRLTGQKGQRHLIQAAPRILKEAPEARFLLIGDGEQRASLARLADSLGVAAAFRFTGHREDVYSLIDAADLVAIPSLWEGLPYSLLESMALAKPIVATRVGGVPEVVIPGQTGILVAPCRPGELARAIADLLVSPALRTRMGEAGRARVEVGFGRRAMIGCIEALYREAAAGAHSRQGAAA